MFDLHSVSFLQIGLAFIEGIGLILSPCILPILPIMLAASLDGGKKRPIGIIVGFIAAFTLFAILSREILSALHVDPEIVRKSALVFLGLFGVVMLSQKLSDKLLGATQGLANFGQNLTQNIGTQDGFFSGICVGGLIGLIWAPCAGPIMAAAVVQIIQAKTNIEAIATVTAFATGAGLPMLTIALLGRQVMSRLSFLKTHSYAVRRVMGVIIIAAAVLIYKGADVQLVAALGNNNEVAVEQPNAAPLQLIDELATPADAPEFSGLGYWLNSTPLQMTDLRGKVVLIDFWTYSCINCVRTLPYLTAWDAKYRDKGLVIIGIHSPEFDFEKKPDNVRAAIEKYGINYPVALDNNLATWGAFGNRAWPGHHLIDKNGKEVYVHYGEGHYDITEHNIRALLGIDGDANTAPVDAAVPTTKDQTQETYLGYGRTQNFAGEIHKDASARYTFTPDLPINNWSLQGAWQVQKQNIIADDATSALRFHFDARKVFLVMGPSNDGAAQVEVWLDGQKTKQITVDRETLYELVDQGTAKPAILELHASKGLQAYAFTFGG